METLKPSSVKFSNPIFILLFISLSAILINSCEKQAPAPPDNNVIGEEGGTVEYDGIRLEIPEDALADVGEVTLERTGNEPPLPNENLDPLIEPLSITIPSEEISESIFLYIPWENEIDDLTPYCAFAYNESTYLPMEVNYENGFIVITIDKINWEEEDKKSIEAFNTIILYLAHHFQHDPPAEELGLKRISLDANNKLDFTDPITNSSSKILILVHGWTGSPQRWKEFTPKFMADLDYDQIWTFGYISRNSIKSNGEIFATHLEYFANDAQIDIVAHSMGGLVSRAMIELHNGGKYVNRLVTLGTPHEGSPLAMFRYLLGDIADVGNPFDGSVYNYLTQGFRDLYTNSEFLQELNSAGNPGIPYYTIAAINDPSDNRISEKISNELLDGPDDGVVSVESALGVDFADKPTEPTYIPKGFAHMEMPKDENIYGQIIDYLEEDDIQPETLNDPRDGNEYKIAQIGDQIWMAENMAYLPSVNPSSMASQSEPYNYVYSYQGYTVSQAKSSNTYETYGALYNWPAAQEACPSGWHLPSDAEWMEMEEYLGLTQAEAEAFEYRGTEIAQKLKSTSLWSSNNGTNSSGFDARPGGVRHNEGTFIHKAITGRFWTSSDLNATEAFGRTLRYNLEGIARYNTATKETGLSVRCVKD